MTPREQELKTIENMRALREKLEVEDSFEALLELVRLSMVSDDEPFIKHLRAGIAEQHLCEVLREAEQRGSNRRNAEVISRAARLKLAQEWLSSRLNSPEYQNREFADKSTKIYTPFGKFTVAELEAE